MKNTDFAQRMRAKFTKPATIKATAKAAKVKKAPPYLTEPVIKMREHIGEFCRKYPKVGFVFNTKTNTPYRIAYKYLHAEDLLQLAFLSFLQHYYKGVNHYHIDNERRGKLGNVQKAKVMLMGVSAGMSDLLLQSPELPDAWIELKVKPNRPTDAQLAFLELQESFGKFTGIAYDLWDCETFMKNWTGK